MTPESIRSTAVLTGATLISAGTAMIYQPAGVIVGGMLLLVMGLVGHIRGSDQ
jgi:hypothetical protein